MVREAVTSATIIIRYKLKENRSLQNRDYNGSKQITDTIYQILFMGSMYKCHSQTLHTQRPVSVEKLLIKMYSVTFTEYETRSSVRQLCFTAFIAN